MADRGLLLSHVDTRGSRGFEVGALMSPFLQEPGADCLLVDRLSTEALREKYAADPNVDIARIAPVDVVIEGNSLFDSLTPRGGQVFDYAIASHVIEHVPDLVGWLEEVARLVRPGGRLLLVVPDKRFTFDRLRNVSVLADVIDAYVRSNTRPSPRQVFDYHALAAEVDKGAAWSGLLDDASLRRHCSLDAALAVTAASYRDGAYLDSHCWVFTPDSFLGLCVELCELRLIRWRLAFFCPTRRDEEDFGLVLERPFDECEGSVVASYRDWRARTAAGQAAERSGHSPL